MGFLGWNFEKQLYKLTLKVIDRSDFALFYFLAILVVLSLLFFSLFVASHNLNCTFNENFVISHNN